MRSSLLVFVVAGLVAAPLAAQQKIDRRVPIAPDVAVRINNLEGTVRIVGWDQDTLAVRGSVPAGVEFYFGGRDRLAKMGVERDPKAKPSGPAFLEVSVPRGARVWVRTGAGGIEAVGLTGELELISVGGTIKADCACRLVTAETIDGGVEVTGGAQVVRARTGSGQIALQKLGSVSEITAVTVSGPIVVTGTTASTGRLETVSGDVTFNADVDRRGRFEVQTHGGDIELRLPATIEAEFDLQSMGGTVLFGLLAKPGEATKPIASGKQILRATGGGGAQITVRSFKGAIRVLPR
jgi:hypothetical protein